MYITSIVTIYYNIILYNHIISYLYIHKQRLWFLWAWFRIQFPLSMVFLISRNLTSAEPLKFLKLLVELRPICYSAMPSDGPQKRRFETTAAESTKSSTGRVILVTGTAGFVGFLVWIEHETETLKSRWGSEDDGPNLCACHFLALMFDLVAVSSTCQNGSRTDGSFRNLLSTCKLELVFPKIRRIPKVQQHGLD